VTNTEFVDFHCHLDLDPAPARAFGDARASRNQFLTVTTTPLAWSQNLVFASDAKNIRVALGLHPQLIGERAADVAAFEQLAPSARYLGEVGLDAGPRFYKSLALQREVFGHVLSLCEKYPGKILSIHCVRAEKELLNLFEKHRLLKNGIPILHWFSGTPSAARRAVELGCWFSINGAMAASRSGFDVVRAIPVDRMVTESDSPFTSPPKDGAQQPGDVTKAIELIARCHQRTIADIQTAVWNNVRSLELAADFRGNVSSDHGNSGFA
jgi:TatD DNase family protein